MPIVLLGVGSYHWFFRDDFFFLTGRKATSVNDLFRPHNGHWSTVPILAFRTLWAVFGMRTYVPYQAAVLALHLGACALLRTTMRRAGVGPWVATAVAAAFVLFGPGEQNIIWAFQIGFTGSLTFGLAQLVLADHDGPVDKRDVFGIVAGVLALLCSGVGIAMAIVAGVAILGRRGWKVAALHVGPLATAYVLWWSVEHPQLASPGFGRPTPGVVFRWVRSSQIGIFLALGHFQVVAALLAVAFVAGLVLAWSRLSWSEVRRRASIPIALLLGGLVFATFTSIDRWFQGAHAARSSRYMHIGVALALPALAVAIDALVRRWRDVGVGHRVSRDRDPLERDAFRRPDRLRLRLHELAQADRDEHRSASRSAGGAARRPADSGRFRRTRPHDRLLVGCREVRQARRREVAAFA